MDILDEKTGKMRKATKKELAIAKKCEAELKKNYKVWEVSYNYDCSFEMAGARQTEKYYVVAETIGDAEKKANRIFFRDDEFKRDMFEKGEVHRKIREYTAKVPFPKLTLEEDVENYQIGAQLRGDGRSLDRAIEYVVMPYLGKNK